MLRIYFDLRFHKYKLQEDKKKKKFTKGAVQYFKFQVIFFLKKMKKFQENFFIKPFSKYCSSSFKMLLNNIYSWCFGIDLSAISGKNDK